MSYKNPFKDPEEKLLFAKVLDKLVSAEKKLVETHTNFLDPVRAESFYMSLVNQKPYEINVVQYGGYLEAERKVIGFYYEENFDSFDSFPITVLNINFNEKFSKAPTHRDYLGGILGLGLERTKIGDIVLMETGAEVYVLNDVANYITENLNKVGRTSVKVTQGKSLIGKSSTGIEKRITVASMRLDAVLSSGINISRGKAAALIESEKVYVNWKNVKKTHTISPNDVITIRGFGRVSIDSLEGSTKKDRIVLKITVYK